MAAEKKRIGRPPLPNREGHNLVICIAVNERESKALRAGAKAAGMTLSAWIRTRALGDLH